LVCFDVSLFNFFYGLALAGATNMSGTSASSTPDNIAMDLALATTADKAVKAIFPFLKELSNDDWWTGLLAAWISFEVEGPPKSVRSFYILI
jgi:hypothetical protein